MSSALTDLDRERAALRSTIVTVGPDAPTACGTWTAADVAIHLVTGELLAALPNAPFRWLVGRGVRLDRLAPLNERALVSWRRRRDFDWAMRRLEQRPPWLHRRGVVSRVSLLEYWAHHEDILAANDVGSCATAVDLSPVLSVLTRYQRRLLNDHAVRVKSATTVWHEPRAKPRVVVDGAADELARWLAGRGGLDAMDVSGNPADVTAFALEHPRL